MSSGNYHIECRAGGYLTPRSLWQQYAEGVIN